MSQTQNATFQRARRPEHRAVRREAILDAAAELLGELPATEVSLREIGRRLGWSKSSVVRYFESREAVFLELLGRARSEWLADLETRLPPAAPDSGETVSTDPAPVRAIADAWADSLARRPLLCELWSILSGVLERNVSVESIRAFKLRNREDLTELAHMMTRRIPGLTESAAQELAPSSVVMLAGLWPFAHPAPAVLEATEEQPLRASRIDFTVAYSRYLQISIAGLTR